MDNECDNKNNKNNIECNGPNDNKAKENDNNDNAQYRDDKLIFRTYFGKYKTIEKIGEGSFGKIYKAEYNNDFYAIKFENKNRGQSLLEGEAAIMNYLKGRKILCIYYTKLFFLFINSKIFKLKKYFIFYN